MIPRPAILLLALLPWTARADEAADAELRKLRESLRALTTQVRSAETERDAAKAAQSGLERKTKELTTKLETVTKQAAADQTASEKKIATLEEKSLAKEKEAALLAANLEKWKAAYEAAADFAKTKEAERAALAQHKIEADRVIAAQQRKNVALLTLATDILKEYEAFSLGKAIANREPFTRLSRVKIENFTQDQTDKLYAQRIKPGQAAPAPTAKPATPPAPEKTPPSKP